MLKVGFDLGKRMSQVALETIDGRLVEMRIKTTREALETTFKKFGVCEILLEASTSSEWVARALEGFGHKVIVADPNFGPMYSRRDKRLKGDRRDALALLEANKLGAYRHAFRRSDENQLLHARLSVRDLCVSQRTRLIVRTRCLLERCGSNVKSCHSEDFVSRLGEVQVSEGVGNVMLPLVEEIARLNEKIADLDAVLEAEAKANPVAVRLDKVTGVGVITSLAFIAAIVDPSRFASAKQVRSYLGLVPKERSSGDTRRLGRLTKAGDSRVRRLLIEAALCIMRSKKAQTASLRAWALQVAERRGKTVAAAALGRKLAGVLFALWRDAKDFDPHYANANANSNANANANAQQGAA